MCVTFRTSLCKMRRVEIRGLNFTLLDDEKLHQKAVMSIDPGKNGTVSTRRFKPSRTSIGTTMDPRLGTVTPDMLCSTCSNKPELCNGHIGDIILQEPVISALFLPMYSKILSSICICCAKLLVDMTSRRSKMLEIPTKKRLTEISNRCLRDRSPCNHCGFPQPIRWLVVDSIIFRPVWPKQMGESTPCITPSHLKNLLSLIDTSTATLFGFNTPSHPSHMMMRYFPVPPILMRPNKTQKCEDDLTTRLEAIVLSSSNLSAESTTFNLSIWDDGEEIIKSRDEWKARHQRNKRPIVPEQLESYYELQRQCAGFQDSKYYQKNDLDYGRELSSVKQRFTATKHRRGRVRANILGKRGDFTARAVASPNTYIDPHEVGVPMSVCMHLTIPEVVHPYNHTKMIQLVINGPGTYPGANFVERNGKKYVLPIFKNNGVQIGDVIHRHLQKGDIVVMNRQPSLHRFSMMGYYVIPMYTNTFQLHLSVTSAHNLDFDGDEVNLFAPGSIRSIVEMRELLGVDRNMIKDGSLLVGFVQHSCLGAYLLTKTNFFISYHTLCNLWVDANISVPCPKSGIHSRDLLSYLLPSYDGTYGITKSTLNRLTYTYLTSYSMDTMSRSKWLGYMVRLFENILLIHGSTLTHMDCAPTTPKDMSIIQEGIDIIQNDTVESRIIKITDKLRDLVGTSIQMELESRKKNNLLDIIESGAKGNRSHTIQNVGMVGQQFNLSSNRYDPLMSHDIPVAKARGFVTSSFSDGLDSIEFFHHLASARIGLIGTAVSTADTGYCYRRITKSLEDVRVCFDHSIRTAQGDMIMPNIGFNTDNAYLIPIRILTLPNLADIYKVDEEELCHLETIRRSYFQHKGRYRKVYMPFDIKTLPGKEHDDNDNQPVTQSDIKDDIMKAWIRLSSHRYIPPRIEPIYFDYLSSHTLWNSHKVRTRSHLDRIISYVETQLEQNMYEPDTPIGIIASQSFSEPLTQIQLNRFHHSGEGSGLVSGVARIKEIINCMKTIQTPSMNIFVRTGFEDVVDVDHIIEVTLSDVVLTWSDKRPGYITLILNRDFMIQRNLVPRIVASRMHEDVNYTRDLTMDIWEVWLTTNVDDIRPQVKQILKSTILIKGIRHLRDFYKTTVDVNTIINGAFIEKQQRLCIVTMGSNLSEVMKLPWVDTMYTTTNDLVELNSVLGIDAMCRSLETNLMEVMTSNLASVSRKYIRIIAHEMCRTGRPCALTFVGLTQSNTSTLKLATFERSLESFASAAIESHTDKLQGISESVIVGKPITVGTGGKFTLIPMNDDVGIVDRDVVDQWVDCMDLSTIPNDVSNRNDMNMLTLASNREKPAKKKQSNTSRKRKADAMVVMSDNNNTIPIVEKTETNIDVLPSLFIDGNPFIGSDGTFQQTQKEVVFDLK